METQGNFDVQAAERIFRKVVHPGLDSMRIVDRNGLSITKTPKGYTNYVRNKTFTLSPRGVPTRTSNHIYSGYHAHISRYGPPGPGTESPEMFVMQSTSGNKSAKLTRPYTHTSVMPSKKRAMSTHSKTARSVQTSRSTSGRHTTRWYFDLTMPGEKRQMKSAHSDHWNKSDQGQRLNREWSSVSDSRALKRSSEILSHRVDRMYFMNGSTISLQPKYLVDEEELIHLRDVSKSHQSAHHPRPKLKEGGPSSRLSSHRALTSAKSKISVDGSRSVEKVEKAKSLDNVIPTRKMDNSEVDRGKSPLHGWDNDIEKEEDLSVKGELIRKKSFHEDQIVTGANDSAQVTERSDKPSVKNDDDAVRTDKNVEDEFDKPDRADGRQNPDDIANIDNNVDTVEDEETWKTRKTEDEERKNNTGEKNDDTVEEKGDVVNENAENDEIVEEENEDIEEKDVIQSEQGGVEQSTESKPEEISGDTTGEDVSKENTDDVVENNKEEVSDDKRGEKVTEENEGEEVLEEKVGEELHEDIVEEEEKAEEPEDMANES